MNRLFCEFISVFQDMQISALISDDSRQCIDGAQAEIADFVTRTIQAWLSKRNLTVRLVV